MSLALKLPACCRITLLPGPAETVALHCYPDVAVFWPSHSDFSLGRNSREPPSAVIAADITANGGQDREDTSATGTEDAVHRLALSLEGDVSHHVPSEATKCIPSVSRRLSLLFADWTIDSSMRMNITPNTLRITRPAERLLVPFRRL